MPPPRRAAADSRHRSDDLADDKHMLISAIQHIGGSTRPLNWDEDAPVYCWTGVKRRSDSRSRIGTVNMANHHCVFHLHAEKLPRLLERAIFVGNAVSGKVDFSQLPSTLERLILAATGGQQAPTGEIETSRLPPNLRQLSVAYTHVNGNVDLTTLPWALKSLNIKGCKQLTGTADLTHLPAKLRHLRIGDTRKLRYKVDLCKLPPSLFQHGVDGHRWEHPLLWAKRNLAKCQVDEWK